MTEKEITKALRWFAKVTTHCEHNIVSCPECEFHGFCTDPYSDDGICKMHECLTAAADTIDRLSELVDAERDGRVVVLPCKVVREIAKIAEVWCG